MNKATKIRVNYAIGGIIMILLLGAIYLQVRSQLSQYDFKAIISNGAKPYLLIAFLIMPVNLALEIYKWKLLVGSAQPISYKAAAKSFLAGLSISLLTPNRIGEYPGRILYLKQKNTPRLISVTFLGMFTQFLCLFLFGMLGLVYFNIVSPGYWPKIILAATLLCTVLVSLVFIYFEKWSVFIERVSFMRRFKTYSQLLKRFTIKEQLHILLITMVRFCIYVGQCLILMKWMYIDIPFFTGFCVSCLFFFAMAVVPSIALAEMGIRGQLSLLLFQNFTTNKIGILVATLVLWFINLIIPAIIGSVLWLKMRLLK